MDDTAVAPVWNARARSSFLIAQAMPPRRRRLRGFSLVPALGICAAAALIGGLLCTVAMQRKVVALQAETIAVVTERAELAVARADACGAAVLPAIDTLRKCRAVIEARDEACACWLAPEGGAQ